MTSIRQTRPWAVGGLSKESSIAEYAALHSRLRGVAPPHTRETSARPPCGPCEAPRWPRCGRFLNDKGIGTDGDYMGLRRVAASGSGQVIWTTEASVWSHGGRGRERG
jgi:hypothetical protein